MKGLPLRRRPQVRRRSFIRSFIRRVFGPFIEITAPSLAPTASANLFLRAEPSRQRRRFFLRRTHPRIACRYRHSVATLFLPYKDCYSQALSARGLAGPLGPPVNTVRFPAAIPRSRHIFAQHWFISTNVSRRVNGLLPRCGGQTRSVYRPCQRPPYCALPHRRLRRGQALRGIAAYSVPPVRQ